MLQRLCSSLRLTYHDPTQEKEYTRLRAPQIGDLFKYIFVCLAVFLVPLGVRFLQADIFPQNYIIIGLVIIAFILLLLRRKIERFMPFVIILYISSTLIIGIINAKNGITRLGVKEAFYFGYSLAFVKRMIDFRTTSILILLLFYSVFVALLFVFIGLPNIYQLIFTICLELLPVILSFKHEKAERSLFDLMFKSKNQLLKFKQLLTEYLPNQIVVFSQNYDRTHFINDAFNNSFNSENINQVKKSLEKLVLDNQDITKKKEMLRLLGYSSVESQNTTPLTLSYLITLVSKKKNMLKDFTAISFQVIESIKETVVENNHNAAIYNNNLNSEDSFLDGKKIKKLEKQKNIETERDVEGEEKTLFQTTESKRRIFKVKVFSLLWESEEAIALVLDDVTHERTIMELKIADRNKDLVIAMVSHELRTPLNGMLGMLEIIKKSITQPELLDYLGACKTSSRLLLNLVNSILDLSQIQNNKLKLIYSEVSIHDLLNDIKSLFSHYCQVKNLSFDIQVGSDVPQTIVTDQTRLSQIIINLVGNAFKFTFKGGVTIKLSKENDSVDRIKFCIEDTGIGIKKENQEKLFKLFGRLEQQDKNINTQGVGLGLTISNTLAIILNPIEKKGIQVDSELGRGTTFSFVVQSQNQAGSKNKLTVPTETDEQSSGNIADESAMSIPIIKRMTTYTEMTKEPRLLNSPLRLDTVLNNIVLESKSLTNIPMLEPNSKFINVNSFELITFTPTNLAKSSNLKRPGNNKNLEKNLEVKNKDQEIKKESPLCLIVDDNPFNLLVAINVMNDKGYQVKTAMNGQEAIDLVKEIHLNGELPKIILMDCQMPVMDGYEASRIITEMMKEGKVSECPIIALTANNHDEEHDKLCINARMSGSIPKPLKIKDLEQIMKKVEKKGGWRK